MKNMNKDKLSLILCLTLVTVLSLCNSVQANSCKDIKLPKLYTITLDPSDDAPMKYKMKILYKNVSGNYTLQIISYGLNDYKNKYTEQLIQECGQISFTLPEAIDLQIGSSVRPVIYEWNCTGRIEFARQKAFQGTCSFSYPVPELGSTLIGNGIFTARPRK